MLLRLTCPSCGRVEQVPDRVVGKEIRCPCGTQFRVLQPKATATARPLGEPRRPTPSEETYPVQRQPEPRSQRPSSARPPENPPSRSRPAPPIKHDDVPERPVHKQPKRQQSLGMPPWAYAAVGAGGVMSLLMMIFVIRALVASPSLPEAPKAAATELASREAPQAPPITQAPAAAADPEPPVEPVPVRTAPPGDGTALTTAQIVARCEPSVALIKGRVSSGTGFVIKGGIIATNAHVIEEELVAGLEVRFPSAPGGKQGPLPAQLLYEDRKRDIAFLAVQTNLPTLEMAPNYAFQKGEDVTVIGNPGLGDEVVLENAISRGVMSAKTVIEGMNYYQMSIAINPGNSGGPVFDSSGRVIGVATLKSSKAEAMGFCIPVEELRTASKQLGRSHPEMIARHRAVAAFKSLTLAGVLYVVGIVARSGNLQGVDTEEVAKLHETVKSLDAKLFSLIDAEVMSLQNESSLSPRRRRLPGTFGQLQGHEASLRLWCPAS